MGKLKKLVKQIGTKRLIIMAVVAICVAVGAGVAVYLHIPEHEDIGYVKSITGQAKGKSRNIKSEDYKKYSDAKDYKEIYDALSDARKRKKIEYYEEVVDSIPELGTKSDEANTAETSSKDNSASADYGTTNIQTKGVDEADIIKNDGKYLYALDYFKGIRIIKADKTQLSLMSEIDSSATEFYVSGDELVIIESDLDNKNEFAYNTTIKLYDISDRKNPKLKRKLEQDGEYLTSRLSEGYLYTITQSNIGNLDNEKNYKNYIPKVDGRCVGAKCICMPENVEAMSYINITSLNIYGDNTFADCKSVVSSGREYYVSTDNIYAVGFSYYEDSIITKFPYEKGVIGNPIKVKTKGYVNDSFSLDEYNGYLRIVTSDSIRSGRTNSLYVYDENLKQVGKIENIAKGESIKSARFLGNMGYFVTYKNMDPLFAVDLSEPSEPKIIDELKITGFSSYLHPYGDGRLLGLGLEIVPETQEVIGIKMSMFDVSDPKHIKEISKKIITYTNETSHGRYYNDYTTTSCQALTNHKAVMVNTEKNVFGFGTREINIYDDLLNVPTGNCTTRKSIDKYYMYSYDESKGFVEKVIYEDKEKSLNDSNYSIEQDYRGTYIGDYLYLVDLESNYRVLDINTGKELAANTFK